MTIHLDSLWTVPRLLFSIPLVPRQGERFQPTGFPGLGAATFRSPAGDCLLVESAQSLANWLERTIWDDGASDVTADVRGISHVRINKADGTFLTDTILESHRLNSPYLLEAKDKDFFNRLKKELGGLEVGPIDRKKLAKVLLKFDVGSLLHGVFLAKKDLAGGRLRVARALSAFIEATGVRVAPSGGVKNDHVNPRGVTKSGFGNVPFARDEFTAEAIILHVNFDLAQIRGYGLGEQVDRLLVLLGLFKLRAFLDSTPRLRTACDLRLATDTVAATMPDGFPLPSLGSLKDDLRGAIDLCKGMMEVSTAVFADKLEVGKDEGKSEVDSDEPSGGDED